MRATNSPTDGGFDADADRLAGKLAAGQPALMQAPLARQEGDCPLGVAGGDG